MLIPASKYIISFILAEVIQYLLKWIFRKCHNFLFNKELISQHGFFI